MAGIMNAGLSVRLVLTLEYDLSLYSLSTGSPNASMADSRQCLNRAVLGSCPLSSVLCLVSNWGVLTRISGQPDAPQTYRFVIHQVVDTGPRRNPALGLQTASQSDLRHHRTLISMQILSGIGGDTQWPMQNDIPERALKLYELCSAPAVTLS